MRPDKYNNILKVFKKCSKIIYGCFKAMKLVKKVIIVINGVPTIYLWRKIKKGLVFDIIIICHHTLNLNISKS